MSFRASSYKNKKEEHKLQVSMSVEDRDKLVKGDKETQKEFLDVLKNTPLKS